MIEALLATVFVTVSWTPPTMREDETALPPEELQSHTVVVQAQSGEERFVVPMPDASVTLDLPPGQIQVTVIAKDFEGLESDPSAPISTEVLPEEIAPPTALEVVD